MPIFDWDAFARKDAYSATWLAAQLVPERQPWVLIDTKTGMIVDGVRRFEITGRPQGCRCNFCRKVIASWGKITKPRPRHGYSRPAVMDKAELEHIPACAAKLLREKLCRWRLDATTVEENQAIEKLCARERTNQRDGRWGTDAEILFDRIIPSLPHPPGSRMVHCLELGLHFLARGEAPQDYEGLDLR